ncbi:MAG: ClpX C4-type zinc finger protein [Vicinamibacterales bacterium]
MLAPDELHCGFCNNQTETRKLIAGPRVFICDQCVLVCIDIILDDYRFELSDYRLGHIDSPSSSVLINHLTELSPAEEWLLLRELLVRIGDRHDGTGHT